MNTYTLVIKAGPHPSGWGFYGWMNEKLPGVQWKEHHRGTAADGGHTDDWVVCIETDEDLTTKLNTWYCEPVESTPGVGFPPGSLLFWAVKK
jgi:hypothetical protein